MKCKFQIPENSIKQKLSLSDCLTLTDPVSGITLIVAQIQNSATLHSITSRLSFIEVTNEHQYIFKMLALHLPISFPILKTAKYITSVETKSIQWKSWLNLFGRNQN